MSPHCRIRGMVFAAAAILLVPAHSQTNNTAGGSSTSGNIPGGAGTSTSSPNGGGATIASGGPGGAPQSVHISGRVLVDDGTAPASQVVIERMCGATAHAEGYTDSKGYFSVQLGQSAQVLDASQGIATHEDGMTQRTGVGSATGMGRGPGGDNRYANCDLRARLSGYTSQSVSLANRGPMDDPNVGIIWIHRIGESEKAVLVTATTLRAPRKARKALEEGLDLAKKNKPEEAIASLQRAVKLYPQFAFAWNELAKLERRHGQIEEARRAFEAAAKAEPRWPEPYLRLAQVAAEANNWAEVADRTDSVLHLSSFGYPEAYLLNGVANYNLRHLDVAEKSTLSAEKLDPQHRFPQTADLLGTILADRHRYAEAAVQFRRYLTMVPNAEDAPAARKRLEEVEKLTAQSTADGK